MMKQDYGEFCRVLQKAAAITTVPNGKTPEKMFPVLFEALSEYALEDVRKAVGAHCREEKFFPMLADIVKRINGNAGDRAAAAWVLVHKAITRLGQYESVRFPVPAIHQAIDSLGGWVNLCANLTYDNISFRQREFEKAYAMAEGASTWENTPDHLPGRHEMNNRNLHGVAIHVTNALTGERTEAPRSLKEPKNAFVAAIAAGMSANADAV